MPRNSWKSKPKPSASTVRQQAMLIGGPLDGMMVDVYAASITFCLPWPCVDPTLIGPLPGDFRFRRPRHDGCHTYVRSQDDDEQGRPVFLHAGIRT